MVGTADRCSRCEYKGRYCLSMNWQCLGWKRWCMSGWDGMLYGSRWWGSRWKGSAIGCFYKGWYRFSMNWEWRYDRKLGGREVFNNCINMRCRYE